MANFLTSGTVVLTEACNLNCKYCYEGGKRLCDKKMTKATAEKIVEFFIKNAKDGNVKSVDITFFGGEPVLNVDVMKHMFDYAAARCEAEGLEFNCMIVTNATLFTEEYKKFLKHWYSVLGRMNVQLSIDGAPKVQDENRIQANGLGSSVAVEETIAQYQEFFKQNNIPSDSLNVHGCVTKSSLPHLKESYDYFRDVLKIDKIWFMPIHEEDWTDEDVELFEDQLNMIGDRIIADCTADKSSKYFDYYSSFLCSTQKPEAPCGAGKTFCSIDTEGNIYPCHRLMFSDREQTIGSIDTGVDEEKREFFTEYDMSNMYGDQDCSSCSNNNCKICIAANYESNKNMVIGFPKYCKMSRLEDDVRWKLRNKLEELKLVSPMKRSACSCGGNGDCHNDEEILEKVRQTYRPVFEALDEQFAKLKDLNDTYKEAFTAIDDKADKALKAANDAIIFSTNTLELVERIYNEMTELKESLNK